MIVMGLDARLGFFASNRALQDKLADCVGIRFLVVCFLSLTSRIALVNGSFGIVGPGRGPKQEYM